MRGVEYIMLLYHTRSIPLVTTVEQLEDPDVEVLYKYSTL
jgi:hypothetical protein